jgi:hypothetical protein
MPINTSPVFTVSGDISWSNDFLFTSSMVSGIQASAYDGTSAVLIHTAGPQGSFVQKLVCEAGGYTGAGGNTACVLRIFINNGSTNATAANNTLYYQYSLPATTQSNIVATAHIEIPLALQLNPNYRLYAIVAGTGGTTTLAGGWKITCIAGEY